MKLNVFKRLKREGKEAARETPSERVMEMSSRGMSEPEIISSLRKEGYSPSDVDSAMKEALRSGAEGPGMRPEFPERGMPRGEPLPGEEPYPEEPLPEEELPARPPLPRARHREIERPLRPEEVEGVPRLPEIPGEEELAPPELPEEEPEEETETPRMAPRRPVPEFEPEEEIRRLQPRYSSRDRKLTELRERRRREIIELTEELVEEKWVEVEDRLKAIEGKFKELDAKISGVEERLGKVKWEKSDEVKAIKDNIDSYRDSMAEMNSKIEGLEKALKSSMTPMMESLRSLSDTIKILKRGKKRREE